MNATARITTTTLDRPRPTAPDPVDASSGRFEQLWAALRDAPARPRKEPAPDPTTVAPQLVSAASVSMALAKVPPDHVATALTAFKRESWLTFTQAAATSIYAAEPAERGGAIVAPVDQPRNGVVADLRTELLSERA